MSADPETIAAYYCFINLGWPPSKFANLDYREKIMIIFFIEQDMKARKERQKG